MERGLNEAEKDYYAARGEIDQVEKNLRNIQHQREGIDSMLMQLQNELNESKLELNSVKERLSVEFNVVMDEVLGRITEEEVAELAEANEEKLRTTLAGFAKSLTTWAN